MTKLKMTMDFDYLNYVTSTKLKNVNDNNVKPVSPENKLLNPTRRRGLLNIFWHLFVLQMTEKFDFSQISMTMPPILYRGLEMTKIVVSIAFLLSAKPKFGSKNVIFWPF